jgi:hypothetical protein
MGVNKQRKTEGSHTQKQETRRTKTKKQTKKNRNKKNKEEKQTKISGSQQGDTNRLPSSDTTIFCSLSQSFIGRTVPARLAAVAASPHCASTVREEATPWRGAPDAAPAGDAGGDVVPCAWPWPWPWELVRWRRHLNEFAWVAGAHTHLGAPPPLGEDADEKLRRMVRGDDAAAPVGVVLLLCEPWNLPSSPVVST